MIVSDDILVQLPTGSGKTIIFVRLLKLLMDKYPTLKMNVLVNKIKLVEQTKDKLLYLIGKEAIGVYCGSLGEYDPNAPITVSSIQSISMRTFEYNVMVIDEAHNEDNSATYKNFILRCRKANPKLKIIRFTATPYTMKGYIYGEDKLIKKLTFKRTLNQMIAEGYLVKPIFKAVKQAFDTSQLRVKRGEFIMADMEKMSKDQGKVQRQVEDALPRLVIRRKIVWAATCIEHATLIKSEIEKYEQCNVVHSELSTKERARNLSEFEEGEVRHLVSIMIVTEGYDYPPIDAIVIMRPTRSPVLYVQLIGRGLRPCYLKGLALDSIEDRMRAINESLKHDCLVLDYGEAVDYFGHPSDPYVPNTGKKNNPAEKKCLICPACETINFLPRSECSSCSYQFLQAEKKEIQRTKALTNVASEIELNANGFQEFILNVIICDVNPDYRTKKGDPCVLIKYSTMVGTVSEYLKKETSYHREWNREVFQNKNLPTKILVEKKGKYYDVIKRIY